MCRVFDELWRVLRDDGVVLLNVGDCYAGTGVGFRPGSGRADGEVDARGQRNRNGAGCPDGLKPKDLCLVPERLALALQARGWYVRSRIAWTKASPMPESCADRPTTAWEHIWLLSKRGTYFWDSEAVKVPHTESTLSRIQGGDYTNTEIPILDDMSELRAEQGRSRLAGQGLRIADPSGANLRNVWTFPPEPSNYDYCAGCDTLFTGGSRKRIKVTGPEIPNLTPNGWDTGNGSHGSVHKAGQDSGRQVRHCPNCGSTDAWVAHYAAFPGGLPRRAILAGTSERGACAECGAPWERVVEKSFVKTQANNFAPERRGSAQRDPSERDDIRERGRNESQTTGWRPTCKCGKPGSRDAGTQPCTVLDPFMGTGTVGIVARQLGRSWVGLEISESYIKLARARLRALAAQRRLV